MLGVHNPNERYSLGACGAEVHLRTCAAMARDKQETSMKKLIVGTAARLAVAGYAVSAWAACPPGTKYNCYGTPNGKQSCGCR